MKRNLPLAFAMCATAAFATMVVVFSGLTATVTNSGLRVNFTASGLAASAPATFNARANATAVYGCYNRGGNNPNAGNKRTTVNGPVRGTTSSTSNASGVASGSISLAAPAAPGFS